MDYLTSESGSPLFPKELLIIFSLIATSFFLFLIYKKRFYALKLYVMLLIFLKLSFFAIGFFVLYPNPMIIQSKLIPPQSQVFPAIEITFDRPVKRYELEKNLYPETPGFWKFENPMYATHLYRKLVFYPYTYLIPETTYTVKLQNIKNFLNSKSSSIQLSFNSNIPSNVLGDATKLEPDAPITITGSFPSDGWDGVSVDTPIRIRFNQLVDNESAQNHFVIDPPVPGKISWDSDTLIFQPDQILGYATVYRFGMTIGVRAQNGTLLKHLYVASFRTQDEITKLDVKPLLQKYSLSCEIAGLRMALSYRGIDASEDEIIKQIGYDPNSKNGNTWGNPYVGFVGRINGSQMKNGYGVYWEPIARVANAYRYSKSFENGRIEDLTQSIQKSIPVISWISIRGRDPFVWTTPTGDTIKAVQDEHVVVVVGFTGPPNDPTNIIVNDPLVGQVYIPKTQFEKKWKSLGNSGVIVY